MSLDLQIISLARGGADRAEIADALGCTVEVVDFALSRAGLKEDEISDDEFARIRDGLINIATSVVEDSVAEKAVRSRVGMFLYERKKGKAKDLSAAPAVNIEQLNLLIQNSYAKVLRSLSGASDQSIRGRAEVVIDAGKKEAIPEPADRTGEKERGSPETASKPGAVA